MGITVRFAGAAASLLTAFVLAGCGSDDSSGVAEDPATSPATSPPTSDSTQAAHAGPACSAVWRAHHRLPSSYKGCTDESGTFVKAQVYYCSDGHRLITYAHTFYAVPGRTVSQAETTLAHDQAFQHTMAVCGA
jgi:hypothetical protein